MLALPASSLGISKVAKGDAGTASIVFQILSTWDPQRWCNYEFSGDISNGGIT